MKSSASEPALSIVESRKDGWAPTLFFRTDVFRKLTLGAPGVIWRPYDLQNSSGDTKAVFNNCFIIHSK